MHSLDRLFRPQSFAVVGASNNEDKVGYHLLYTMREFAGKLYPINPKTSEIQGIKAYPNLKAVEAPIDIAALCIPARTCLGAIKEAGEAGYIQLTGRGKDTIKRGGESIFAAKIENLICDHPQVDAVAVIDIPDPEMGERVCAVIQPQPGADLSLDDVSDYLKSRGASVLQLPEHLRIVAAIALTPAGKLDKKRLKAGVLPTFDTCISAQAKMKETPC